MGRLYRLLVGLITCNRISKVGGYLATFGAISGAVYLVMTLLSGAENAYGGIIFLAVVPPAFFGGLLLVPLGLYFEFKRRCRQDPSLAEKSLGTILQSLSGESDVRNRIITFVVFSGINVALTMIIFVASLDYLDSPSFCGQLCHSVMIPEFTAYERSPHARVPCVQCHIGPGASWFVKSKIAGLRQVYAIMAKTYNRPIPTPIEQLRPARDTCEQCHWPQKFNQDKLKIITHYRNDRNNTKYYTALLLKVGGPEAEGAKPTGIHWHVSGGNRVIYASEKGERKDIPWIRLERDGQQPVEYRFTGSNLSDAEIAALPRRTMDCVDCHNRPTHIYRPADTELETMFARFPELQSVPYLKKAASEVMERHFSDDAIEAGEVKRSLIAWFGANPEEKPDPRLLKLAADKVQEIYRQNVWPKMNIGWGTYPNHIGHTVSQGCLRCHGNNHVTAEGKAVRSDCRLCHTILALEEEKPPLFDYMVHKEK
ncbi:MAG TPA: NapC/NirT family cytochrome c [Acidobacteriota bacterium]|nr:NapC/NirT family cytochrome c [Acidobacteriota bacterium]